ncbi:MAG: hypothetical protein AAF675_15230 [Pseudomonadota bacterium]
MPRLPAVPALQRPTAIGTAMLAVLLTGSAPAFANEPPELRTTTQTNTVDGQSVVRDFLFTREDDRAQTALAVIEALRFDGADPAQGRLHSVRLDLALQVQQDFSATIGDGLPLDEASEPVAIEAQFSTRLEVLGPEGTVLHAQVLDSPAVGCSGMASCLFESAERSPVALSLDLDPAAFEGIPSATISLRLTTIEDAIAMVCDERGDWDRCRVIEASIALTAPEDGISLRYTYEGAGPVVAADGGQTPAAFSMAWIGAAQAATRDGSGPALVAQSPVALGMMLIGGLALTGMAVVRGRRYR